MPPAKQEPESDEEDDGLKEDGKLCVLYNQEEETVFVVKPTTLFKKIRTAIAKKYGIEEKSFKMNYESANCLDDFTPKMMEMQVGRSYRLDTFTEQVGGRLCLRRGFVGAKRAESRVDNKRDTSSHSH